ncbi:MAG TPA: serine hydrolase domain-containing protein [Steroidobacteraceae bacterium]|nr:serine hydrolase domain-containing protein [Steroidobacteraceae bacterium]
MRRTLYVALAMCSSAAAADATTGFSPARLEHVTTFVQSAIDQGQYAGAVILVSSHGRIVLLQGLGYRTDAIFQIYSMTKPITSVAALVLMEQSRLSLDDPVSRFLPEFAPRPITIKHLPRGLPSDPPRLGKPFNDLVYQALEK